ncbi:methyl-accepting chemotaxis protein [Desulfovibrio cuneatus]|uniref:methyl-accepting chemotaxis protein n=1 Tax=Desulfovibrio cuneatus TaxID=159728 RepID=UPI00068610FB|nr:methyl-accepting chemotaxis protein [Desulfovibrio cuneatus]
MGLQSKLILPIVVLVTLLVGTTGYLSYRTSEAAMREDTLDAMRGEAEAAKRAISGMIVDGKTDMLRIATDSRLAQFFSGDQNAAKAKQDLAKLLDVLAESYPHMDTIDVLNMDGTIVAASDPTHVGVNSRDADYFQTAMRGETKATNPFVTKSTGKTVIAISTPIMNEGRKVGVVLGTVFIADIFERFIKPIRLGESGSAFLLSDRGNVVAHQDPKYVFDQRIFAHPTYQKIAQTGTGSLEGVDINNNLSLFVFAQDEESGIIVVVRAITSEIFAPLVAMRNDTLMVIAISAILGALVIIALIRPVVRTLQQGVNFAEDIAAGKFDTVFTVNRKDELGVLANALRTIPAELQKVTHSYAAIETNIINGDITAQADSSQLNGEFAGLIQATNGICNRFCRMINGIPSPVVIMNPDHKILFMNQGAQDVAGTDYRNKTCKQMFNLEDDGTAQSALDKAFRTNKPATNETVAHPGGKRMDVQYSSLPLQDKQGQLTAMMLLITDLTTIKETQRVILDVANQATDISNRMAAASEQLSAQVEEVSHGTDVQRDRAASTATAMEEMNATVLEVARSASDASQQAESTRGKAEEGAHLVHQVVTAIEEVNTTAMEMQKNMEELGRQAESIGGVMNVISDIADQTNLLALNAAIEAARAGEAGRGFAVVADEVRKLAEKTMSATTEVGGNIRGIQNSTSVNIERMGAAARAAASATERAGVSGTALEEILHLAQGTSALIASIATAAEEQSATSEEINASIDAINNIATDTASGMVESASAVQEVSRMAQELRSLLGRLQK